MSTRELDFLNLEEELQNTRKKLNILIQEYYMESPSPETQLSQESERKALYQDKINYLETEIEYLYRQLQLLKGLQPEAEKTISQAETFKSQTPQNAESIHNAQTPQNAESMHNAQTPQNAESIHNAQTPQNVGAIQTSQEPQDQQIPQYMPLRQNPQIQQQPQTFQNIQVQQQNPQAQPQQKVFQNIQVQQQNLQMQQQQQAFQSIQVQRQNPQIQQQPQSMPYKPSRKPQEYEKIFGKSFMGVFASVLIFISLIIFATVVLPYLSDALKLTGLYVLSFGILGVGLFLYRKNKYRKFYIAVIGCGVGSLYLSLLLSNLYFKLLGDIALYCLILVWAVLVKNLTRLKNLVFQIIGQAGIFIATILGTILCVSDGDEKKFFVLTIFYLVSSCVFSEIDKTYLKYLTLSRKNADTGQMSVEPPYYEDRLCSHICKSLNGAVLAIGFLLMDASGFKTAAILLLMLYLLLEYYLSFRETCRHGLAFQMLTVANTFLMIVFFYEVNLIPEGYSNIFIYLAAIATLAFAEIKNAEFKIYTLIWCAILTFIGCWGNHWIREHLYVYLTVIPCLLYGKWKDRKIYLNTGVVYLGGLWMVILPSYDYSGFRGIECFIMIAAMSAAFLHVCHKAENAGFKIAGYILLNLTIIEFANDAAFTLMNDYNLAHLHEIAHISSKAKLVAFFTVALIHLLLSKWNYFGNGKPVEGMMYTINALLMCTGLIFMHTMPWQIPTILITVLLFLVNSKGLLSGHASAGYYIAFKYTILMISILNSFHTENYVISICLLLFAIASIVTGFYKSTASFRLYGLILSMISVIKLILIDIHYDSTLENALSFFVCGVLCFIISFIYHKIDTGFKNKEN